MDARQSEKRLSSSNFLHPALKFRARKYFTDHHLPCTIHGFGESVLVCKIHDCYCRICKNFEQHIIPSYSSDTSDYNG